MRVCAKCCFVRKILYPVFPEKLNASKQKYFGRPPWAFQYLNFWTVKTRTFLANYRSKKLSPWNEFHFSFNLNCLLCYGTNSSFFLFFLFLKETNYSVLPLYKIQTTSVLWIQPFIKQTKVFHKASMWGAINYGFASRSQIGGELGCKENIRDLTICTSQITPLQSNQLVLFL